MADRRTRTLVHRALAFSLAAIAPLALWSASSCLPVDTRPPPSSILVTVVGSPLARDGITASMTTDGWAISFDRFLVVLGRETLDGDSCSAYAEADYKRLYDGRYVDSQKLGQLYGLGTCRFGFRLQNPDPDTYVMAGATEDDLNRMRTPGSDHYTMDTGISVDVRGTATKGAVTKTFSWSFRPRRIGYTDCVDTADLMATTSAQPLTLVQNGALIFDLRLHVETLFQDSLDYSQAKLRFDPFANADDLGDKNGDVTLDELAAVSLADIGLDATTLSMIEPNASTWMNLQDFVYLGLFPRVVRYGANGHCRVTASSAPSTTAAPAPTM
jgi:hypothetical protein